jgi:4-amino-4-deoxy-L-arabinose transferase-like glycosyltransferase
MFKRDRYGAFLIGLLHLSVALYCLLGRGVSIRANPRWRSWDRFWQTIPLELVRTDFPRSIWYLHSQPPLFNIWGGVLAKLFPSRQLYALHYANIGLGALLSGMLYLILVRGFLPRWPAFGVAAILSLSPPLFLYEAYILYDVPSAFLAVLSVYCLSWFWRARSSAALCSFIGSCNLLILMRSIYQAVLLVPAGIIALTLIDRSRRKRALLISAAISIPTFVWYLKNYSLFDFWGTSSWFGISQWKVVTTDYSREELRGLQAVGILDPVAAQVKAYSRPASYREYGFDRRSDVPVLARNDYHNINIPEISRAYAANAPRLIAHDPARYARTLLKAYIYYCRPSSHFRHVTRNAAKIRGAERLYANALAAGGGGSGPVAGYGSILFFLIPASLLMYAFQLCLARCDRRHLSWAEIIRGDPVMLWCGALIVYTTAVSCLCEHGENERYRFLVENITWVFIAVVFYRPGAALKRRLARSRPRPLEEGRDPSES